MTYYMVPQLLLDKECREEEKPQKSPSFGREMVSWIKTKDYVYFLYS